nr:hypothetical protein [Streptomyces sp. S10(2018)]
MTYVDVQQSKGRSLVSDALFGRLTDRIAKEHPDISPDLAARIMDQALAFLGACAAERRPLRPSGMVDVGWHAFILHTADYAEFCERIAGRFIHHEPDVSGQPPRDGTSLPATVQAIKAAGYEVDPQLWADGRPSGRAVNQGEDALPMGVAVCHGEGQCRGQGGCGYGGDDD